jgi:hypothetical protein
VSNGKPSQSHEIFYQVVVSDAYWVKADVETQLKLQDPKAFSRVSGNRTI